MVSQVQSFNYDGYDHSYLGTRILNLPLHFWTPNFLADIGNSLGHFSFVDTHRMEKGIVTFSHIFVENDLSRGLLEKILID